MRPFVRSLVKVKNKKGQTMEPWGPLVLVIIYHAETCPETYHESWGLRVVFFPLKNYSRDLVSSSLFNSTP